MGTTARGRLSPRLRPSPTTMVDTDSDTTDLATALATVAMEDTTTAREAEAEPKAAADPYLLYGGVYGHGLGYGYGYGLGGYRTYWGYTALISPRPEPSPENS